ncbi:MAG: hypothetical protein DMF81_23975 [Acidobacteria bacterium]|nr:MAG: hypothetical protein DMF81_23975 [Acidobacteriota bacterium]
MILVIVGVVSIAFSKAFATRAGKVQRRLFRVELAPRFLQLGYIFGGVVFCIVGGLALLGLLHFGP